MSREPKIRIARPITMLGVVRGVCAGIALSGALFTTPATAQVIRQPRLRVSPRANFPNRPSPRISQNESPQRPLGRPTAQAPKPQVIQHRQPPPQIPATQLNQQPVPERLTPRVSAAPAPLVTPNRPGQTQQHLADWMENHRSLSLAQQQRALENEPGFKTLNPQVQQQLHQRLTQLNGMAPDQRQRILERTEAMERLAPVQRQQVRNAMAQLGSIPEERRHIVSRQFYQLRDMPADQRQTFMNSPQYQGQFSEQERGAVDGLLNVTPIYGPLQAQSPQPR